MIHTLSYDNGRMNIIVICKRKQKMSKMYEARRHSTYFWYVDFNKGKSLENFFIFSTGSIFFSLKMGDREWNIMLLRR